MHNDQDYIELERLPSKNAIQGKFNNEEGCCPTLRGEPDRRRDLPHGKRVDRQDDDLGGGPLLTKRGLVKIRSFAIR